MQITNTAVTKNNDDEYNMIWKNSQMRKWIKIIWLFKKHDLMLMHMTNKLLTHETELIMIQFRNSINKKSHKIFVKNKIMIIMIMYYKKIKINKKIKIIYYYLSCEIRKLILYHIWLIILFWRKLKIMFNNEKIKKSSTFLWKLIKKKLWKNHN